MLHIDACNLNCFRTEVQSSRVAKNNLFICTLFLDLFQIIIMCGCRLLLLMFVMQNTLELMCSNQELQKKNHFILTHFFTILSDFFPMFTTLHGAFESNVNTGELIAERALRLLSY